MRKIFLLILLVFLVGCAHTGTVKPLVNDARFQEENLPLRTLSVCVISEGSWPRENIEELIRDASRSLTEQVGIQLKIEGWMNHRIPSFTRGRGLERMVEIIGKEHRKYDMVIGFSSRGLPSHLIEMSLGYAWFGVIDDSYRKFVVMKVLDKRILMHEICHAFIFTRIHGANGLMSMLLIKAPLVPVIFNLPEYLSVEDRKEVLQHKWRSFNEKPEIPKEDQVDTTDVPAD